MQRMVGNIMNRCILFYIHLNFIQYTKLNSYAISRNRASTKTYSEFIFNLKNKNRARHEKLPFMLLVSWNLRDFPRNIGIALGCLIEFEGKSLLLNKPHSSDTGLGGSKLESTWKTCHSGQALVEYEVSTQVAKRERWSIVLLSNATTAMYMARHPQRF